MRRLVLYMLSAALLGTMGCRAGFSDPSIIQGDVGVDAVDDTVGGDAVGGDAGEDIPRPDVTSDTVLPPVECPNGLVEDGEQCDDGNDNPDDGCHQCQISYGYACAGAPSDCWVQCGDGIVYDGVETCDDGGSLGSDGCSDTCEVEEGWFCRVDEGTDGPSFCLPVCGDGVILGGEACDDFNEASGDGCSETCEVEPGWSCYPGEEGVSICEESCGDGELNEAIGEQCDDQNAVPGDGCTPTCQIEPGWVCPEGANCATECGDGLWAPGGEACDDDNLVNGDGCNEACQEEAGFDCTGLPGGITVCASVCGDGIKASDEACDDDNLFDGDGCSANCEPETGWTCEAPEGQVTVCTPICTDGIILPNVEACDDGNENNDDGCSNECQVNAQWTCTTAADAPSGPSLCCLDPDQDLYGAEGASCLGYDCNEENPQINAGALEICDGQDNDCDSQTDEGLLNACGNCGDLAIEVCDGIDNDCNGETDEGTDVACDGPANSDGSVCTPGFQRCIGGTLTDACLGAVLPSPESCDSVDNDCDGETDEDLGFIDCGEGECAGQVPACGAQLCGLPPFNPNGDQCDGLDNDCDGAIDEDCVEDPCVYVYAFAEASQADGSFAFPAATITQGIQLAADDADKNTVCVMGEELCAFSTPGTSDIAFFDEQVTMANGIHVFGGYSPNQAGVRDPVGCPVEILSSETHTVRFPPTVVDPTILDGFIISNDASLQDAAPARTVIVNADGGIVSNNVVYASSNANVTVGIMVPGEGGQAGGSKNRPRLVDNAVFGSAEANQSYGIWVQNAAPYITSCSNESVGGKCLGGGFPQHLVVQTFWPEENGLAPVEGTAIRLQNAGGTIVERVNVFAVATQTATGIDMGGDAADTRVTDSSIWVEGASQGRGIALGCNGAGPVIEGNHQIVASGVFDGPPATSTRGIYAKDCSPLIQDNDLIAGGAEGQTLEATGIYCDVSGGASAACSIIGNKDILGALFGQPVQSTGIQCDGQACALIADNTTISGNGGLNTVGLLLQGANGTLVDSNGISGGCPEIIAQGVLASNSTARLVNNIVSGGGCDNGTAVASSLFAALWVSQEVAGVELDVHSNMFSGDGSLGSCGSVGVVVAGSNAGQTAYSGIYRNNIMRAGLCFASTAMGESGGQLVPRVLEHNILWNTGATNVIYLDDGTFGGGLASGTPLNTGTQFGAIGLVNAGNIIAAPGLGPPSGNAPFTLLFDSPARDSGTAAGAPSDDFRGLGRPSGNGYDIGPIEQGG